MDTEFTRTAMLIGNDAQDRLASSSVLIIGVGGVGGYVTEALARSGVSSLTLIDSDKVDITNINRQIIALHSTIGQYKTEVMAARIKDINPQCNVTVHNCFYLPENASEFDFTKYDYIADCVDTVSAKLDICERAVSLGIPVISAMGAGNKLDPTGFRVSDISKTEYCPLAKVMRRELRKRGINHLKVVFSPEQPRTPSEGDGRTPGSIAFVPSSAGLVMAGEMIRDLSGIKL